MFQKTKFKVYLFQKYVLQNHHSLGYLARPLQMFFHFSGGGRDSQA